MPDAGLTPITRREITVRQDEDHVLLIVNGRDVLNVPWDAALEISKAMHQQAKKAEEIAKVAAVVKDHAILVRAGWPIGLAVDPRVRKEAEKAAVNDSDLRRYMPGGVKSQESVGTPGVRRHRPTKEQQDATT